MEKIISDLRVVESEIAHVKELMTQHDKLTEQAIIKAEKSLTDQLEKLLTNIENLAARFEQNIKSVTERQEESIKVINDKMDTLERHANDKMDVFKSNVDDKRNMLLDNVMKSINGMRDLSKANLDSEILKFESVDKQMQVLINTNAEKSNEGIAEIKRNNKSDMDEIKKYQNQLQGSIKTLMWFVGFLSAVAIVLLGFYLKK